MRDEEFLRNKVPMTKEAVRAISIDKLNLWRASSMLDIGAGTGSISIQAAREWSNLAVTAIERNPDGIDIINQNLAKFGLKNVNLIQGSAPEALPDQQFDAIFVGGTGPNLQPIMEYAWRHVRPGGAVVLNFILLENALEAERLMQVTGFKMVEMTEVAVAKWHALGKGHYFKPNNKTMILSGIKEEQE
ncbi:decarboxylating cobalt-precorrin-6B (C(15))-methyltransferase [Lactobacillus sp. 3B(2020)]|uniref:decarboxylating cobalt-precorrin-6B (C(15))-methyltransferase n=1 Tax=Lactobacillus sp. 3B(2020) TaxID=2695882 RepID=UPI0015DE301C|nr:decarboxylating cobalt-precorrin-6B (C(15))-methyltransferase [Lactobacillus sp. 3B(2020)]QLL69172.1 decarboxylating cobalt-precorrin-6B (C(15))-methyltransferase [Lactobacillus sp. 3B(2020)]